MRKSKRIIKELTDRIEELERHNERTLRHAKWEKDCWGTPVYCQSYVAVREGDELVVRVADPRNAHARRYTGYRDVFPDIELARGKTPAGLRKILDPKLTKITIVDPEVREEV